MMTGCSKSPPLHSHADFSASFASRLPCPRSRSSLGRQNPLLVIIAWRVPNQFPGHRPGSSGIPLEYSACHNASYTPVVARHPLTLPLHHRNLTTLAPLYRDPASLPLHYKHPAPFPFHVQQPTPFTSTTDTPNSSSSTVDNQHPSPSIADTLSHHHLHWRCSAGQHTHGQRDKQGTGQGSLNVLDLVRCSVKTKACPNTALGAFLQCKGQEQWCPGS